MYLNSLALKAAGVPVYLTETYDVFKFRDFIAFGSFIVFNRNIWCI